LPDNASDGNLDGTCAKADALRQAYLRWARLYAKEVAELLKLTKDPIEQEFFVQLDATEKARIASGQARLAYENHRKEHGCTVRASAA
jgi:hypothetical protein